MSTPDVCEVCGDDLKGNAICGRCGIGSFTPTPTREELDAIFGDQDTTLDVPPCQPFASDPMPSIPACPGSTDTDTEGED